MQHQISVRWSWPQAYLNPLDFFDWSDKDAHSNEKFQQVESILAWPQGTLHSLHAAFTQKLGRQTGWRLDNISSLESAQALMQAASVFKRGVFWSYRGTTAPRLHQQGEYQIFVPQPEASLTTVLNLVQERTLFTVIDRNVAKHWNLVDAYPDALLLDTSEHAKTLETVAAIIEQARRTAPGKSWLIIGGGILGDIAAFAASIEHTPFCFMPTTLLSMADACVGGKTGVNFPPFGKNQVGSFAFPSKVIAWAGWLASLPKREWRAGGAECLKHGFLSANQTLSHQIVAAFKDTSPISLGNLLPQIIRVKAEIIAQDPTESGIRATLNLGHTLAHALEAISQESDDTAPLILHGEAVAIGLVMAGIISQKICQMAIADFTALRQSLASIDCLPTLANLQKYMHTNDLVAPDFVAKLLQYISQDKKNSSGENRSSQWILLKSFGKISEPHTGQWSTSVDQQIIAEAWPELLSYLEA